MQVTFFWNGNVSGYFNEELETYVEIPSDKVHSCHNVVCHVLRRTSNNWRVQGVLRQAAVQTCTIGADQL